MTQQQTLQQIVNRNTTHLAGMFVVHADGSFLNGAGLGTGEDKNVSTVKRYWTNKPIPYVSSQAWRRWLRDTLVEETGWEQSRIEAIDWSAKGNTSQVAGQLNPIDYPEDDLFGYMFAKPKKEHDDRLQRERLPDVKLIRTSPFKSSLLSGVPELTHLAEDDGFVHLKDDNPLPYTTEFYSGELSAIFGLEVHRIGVFETKGKESIELDPYLYEQNSDQLEKMDHPVYPKGEIVKFNDLIEYQDKLTAALLRALVRLRGGSKLTQFGTDVSPKLIILAGLKTGNLLFDDLLQSDEGNPSLNISALQEIITDYSDKLTTDVFIGQRTGYLTNEEEVKELTEQNGINLVHGSPQEVIEKFIGQLD